MIDAPFRGVLLFGVGTRDETAVSAGTAHLAFHLIMKRLGEIPETNGAELHDDILAFAAEGDPADVADYLNRVAQIASTLREVTDVELAEAKDLMTQDLGERAIFAGRGAFVDRFGARNFGLLQFGSPAYRSLSTADIDAFSDAWLHQDNAVLTFGSGAVT